MKIGRIVFLIAFSLIFGHAVVAQNKPVSNLVPDKVMDADLKPLDDSAPLKLSFYRNRVVVLALWASWCGPCRMAVTGLNKLNKDFSYRGVEMIALTTKGNDPDDKEVRAFVREKKIAVNVGWIDDEMAKALVERSVLPQIFVIAGDGVIVKKFVGWSPTESPAKLREAIEQALTNPPVRQQ